MSDDSNTVLIEALKEEVNRLHVEIDELRETLATLRARGGSPGKNEAGEVLPQCGP